MMSKVRLASAVALILILLAACGTSPSQPAQPDSPAPAAASAATLMIEAANAERIVQPGADEVFDFKMVNTSGEALPVLVQLEPAGGQRWRTSLCVDKQCVLGNGSEASVSDPVMLSPYVEQPFQVHLFVDSDAQPGQRSELTLRVKPQAGNALSPSATVRAQVAAP